MTILQPDASRTGSRPAAPRAIFARLDRRYGAGSAIAAQAMAIGLSLALIGLSQPAFADVGHPKKPNEHANQMQGAGDGMMGEGMLVMPRMDAARGRQLFADKGCVVCHAINGVGGEDAPPLDADVMSPMMNPFEFAANMWRGAEAMVMLQQEELGEQIELNGQELADIIAFVHSHEEQAKFTEAGLSDEIKKLIEHDDTEEKHD